MKKNVSILFAFLFFFIASFGQKAEKELRRKTWFSNSGFGPDNVLLTADNSDKPALEIRFLKTGKVLVKQLKKRGLDSSFTYIVNKRKLTINLNLKDSVETLEYILKKVPGKKAYSLSINFSSRYIKKRRDDTITLDRLVLIQGKKRKIIENQQSLTIFSQKRALKNDSIDLAVWGQFMGYITDTILVDSDQYVAHNFYKKYTDSLHYIAPLLLDTVVRMKIPIKDITGIYTQREPFTSYATGVTILAMCTGLACVATSILLPDHSSATSVFAEAGVGSLLIIPFSFGAGMIFSTQKFLLKPTPDKKRIWTIERHMPNVIVTTKKNKKAAK